MINEYERSQMESDRRRQDLADMRHAAFVIRSILAVPFIAGLCLLGFEMTRPVASALVIGIGLVLAVPFLATWRWPL